jgi:HSP20 family protein
MALDRWDPFREMMTLREAMDRLFQQSVSGTGQLLSNIRPEAFPLDVIERDDAFEVRASVPGVKPEDLEVTVQGERLTLRAETKPSTEERRGENWLLREHRYGAVQRSVTLPSPVNSEQAEARIEHGVLTLRLPKLQEARPRRISVGPGTPSAQPHAGDTVTSQSAESFPASDPPSYTPEKL